MRMTLVIEAGAVSLSLHKLTLGRWQTLRRARLPFHDASGEQGFAELLTAALRPTLLAWGVPTQTPVLLVPPGDMGGVLTTTVGKPTQITAEVERVASQSLPFAPQDLLLCHQTRQHDQTIQVYIAWLPKRWVDDCESTLARLGMRLDEVLPRAFLLPYASVTSGPFIWLLQSGETITAYKIVREQCQLVLNTDLQSDPQAQHLLASLAALDGATAPSYLATVDDTTLLAPAAAIRQAPAPDWLALAFQRWALGDAGWWSRPTQAQTVALFAPVLIGLALLLLTIMAVLTWRQHQLDQANRSLEASADRLRPNHSRLESRQRELFKLQADLLQAESISKPTHPLDALALLAPALPMDSRIASYQFSPAGVVVEGYGIDNERAIKALATTRLIAKPAPVSLPKLDKLASFALTLTIKPDASKPNAKPH